MVFEREGNPMGGNAGEPREKARVADWLNENPVKPMIWMNTGALGPVVSKGGLRFSEIIHEGSLRWHEIDDHIPEDVSTVIFQQGDPIDVWLRNNSTLADDLAQKFQQTLSVGNITVYRRK